MLAHVPGNHSRVSVEAAAGRKPNNEPDGFSFVEIFLRENGRRLRGEDPNDTEDQQRTKHARRHRDPLGGKFGRAMSRIGRLSVVAIKAIFVWANN
jgi:hypothetical protein